jgi:hypothetical protein
MLDFCELEEFELDVVAGGNPINGTFTVSVSAISSTVTATLNALFSNAPAAAAAITINQNVS